MVNYELPDGGKAWFVRRKKGSRCDLKPVSREGFLLTAVYALWVTGVCWFFAERDVGPQAGGVDHSHPCRHLPVHPHRLADVASDTGRRDEDLIPARPADACQAAPPTPAVSGVRERRHEDQWRHFIGMGMAGLAAAAAGVRAAPQAQTPNTSMTAGIMSISGEEHRPDRPRSELMRANGLAALLIEPGSSMTCSPACNGGAASG
jgi:hypothetical protein